MYLRVSDHITEIIEFVAKLLENGKAYAGSKSGSIYFDSAVYKSSGFELHKLRPVSGDDCEIDVQGEKRLSTDFCLWKNTGDGFESPFGLGRPGWHIECSTFVNSFFGNSLDMHGGGIDLQLHHENEIAQCESYWKKSGWCKIFLHTGHLFIENRKMSKSLKNFISIEVFLFWLVFLNRNTFVIKAQMSFE